MGKARSLVPVPREGIRGREEARERKMIAICLSRDIETRLSHTKASRLFKVLSQARSSDKSSVGVKVSKTLWVNGSEQKCFPMKMILFLYSFLVVYK